MEGELYSFLKVSLLVIVSLLYCYALEKIIPQGNKRLLCALPIVFFFLTVPLNYSIIHFRGTTAFFIGWLANFKLLLFAYGKGPLSSNSSLSLGLFMAVACLPIKIQQSQHQNSHVNGRAKQNPVPRTGQKSVLNYATKGVLYASTVRLCDSRQHIHPDIISLLYCCQIYFYLEITLALAGYLAGALFGFELEPQFNEPYLSSSLQDFWGRRWNLMVSSILRPTVYEPVRKTCTPFIGRRPAQLTAIFGTFVVSGAMHELILSLLGNGWPTWEVTCFFLLHGSCLVAEVAVKQAINDRWRLPRLMSTPLAVGFVLVTGYWLFLPPLIRCQVFDSGFKEYDMLREFLMDGWSNVRYKVFQLI
uniref:Acyltransferase n=1 Tax=Rhizophora mucronata TaxID=61149 RepID=A0A2P2IRX7_RHIMU